MAMSVGGDGSEEKPLSDINTTPLVDVMLVLLIIFLIAVPVVVQSVELQLPKVEFEPTTTKPENVSLSVRGSGNSCEVYWNLTPVSSGELRERAVKKLEDEVARQGGPNAPGVELPEVHIRGDVNTPYRCIGGTIYTMQSAGFAKVGFISEPEPGGTPRL
ncbi:MULTISPECIES: ExbD/TolR family protein [Sphingomonas]|jgi:biopolymer transport protein ExbD|uniref:Biopolymer transporter ExbD n=2 Tax=Sphingomonas TaxID=13687 RepID=A0A4Q2IYX5_9SPHN|nr:MULTISPECIES: biopolymer transporter ExbD [Sphingomonas]GLK19440.1 biopolymer transporter ExbD [Microbacterium terregens]MBB3909858.1 biopolymer transport protein ExbD [Sphingomonas desiccabilis]MBM7407277.1 biopolymer transport protein ExbD [Sphingomonas sp. JUb134]MCG7347410.1 biopolymer transporter ExbD [Sphingomonas sp. ACRSK]RSV16665.1 biopolymer transporter ExbD [Sphingomonas sp. ABOLF]